MVWLDLDLSMTYGLNTLTLVDAYKALMVVVLVVYALSNPSAYFVSLGAIFTTLNK